MRTNVDPPFCFHVLQFALPFLRGRLLLPVTKLQCPHNVHSWIRLPIYRVSLINSLLSIDATYLCHTLILSYFSIVSNPSPVWVPSALFYCLSFLFFVIFRCHSCWYISYKTISIDCQPPEFILLMRHFVYECIPYFKCSSSPNGLSVFLRVWVCY